MTRHAAARLPLVVRAALLAPLMALAACGDSQQSQRNVPPPPTVIVAKPATRTVTDHDEYVGRFIAVDAVEVRARVSGYLEKVHFTDGQLVKTGDLLFTIDRRPLQNTQAQAQANLAQARANLAFTTSDLERAQQLYREKTISEQVFEQRNQAKRIAEASVAANEALLRQATLDLEFTELRAPVSGRIGDRRVSPGNLVTGGTSGNTTLLATIQSIDPIRFEFTFDEAALLRYRRNGFDNVEGANGAKAIDVKLRLIDEPNFVHGGKLDFLDNAIDRSTGTIRGRAQFGNPSGLFMPGMFARLQVAASPPYEAVTIPDVAVASEQTRRYVLVADPENTIRMKYVTLGPLVDGQRVVKDGLTAADRVVVNGMMQARPGQKATVQEQPAPAPTSAANPPTTRAN
jgi:RND family efflux transporter MFP subunit